MNTDLAKAWNEEFYDQIVRSLHYSVEEDISSRNLLSHILRGKPDHAASLRQFRARVFRQTAFVFGAGPSLEQDLSALIGILRKKGPTIISSDGAADRISELGLVSDAIVSDLDSCSLSLLTWQSNNVLLFVHAHGDNKKKIRNLVPWLGDQVLGTTQVGAVRRVANYGGFTDGDRACYITSTFRPKRIILAGMNFSRVGQFRKCVQEELDQSRALKKLEFGRRSLEFLIRKTPEIEFINVSQGEATVNGAKHLNYEEFNEWL